MGAVVSGAKIDTIEEVSRDIEDRVAGVCVEEVIVGGSEGVMLKAEDDIGGNVDLVIGVLPVGAALDSLAVGFPSEASAWLAFAGRVGAGAGEGVDAEHDEIACVLGLGIEEEWKEVHLGIPEEASPVGFTGVALGVDGCGVGVRVGAEEMKEGGACGLLGLSVAFDVDIAGVPCFGPGGSVLGEQIIE